MPPNADSPNADSPSKDNKWTLFLILYLIRNKEYNYVSILCSLFHPINSIPYLPRISNKEQNTGSIPSLFSLSILFIICPEYNLTADTVQV